MKPFITHSLQHKQRLTRSCWIIYNFTYFISEILYFNEIDWGGGVIFIRDTVQKFNSGPYLYNKVLNSKQSFFCKHGLTYFFLVFLDVTTFQCGPLPPSRRLTKYVTLILIPTSVSETAHLLLALKRSVLGTLNSHWLSNSPIHYSPFCSSD